MKHVLGNTPKCGECAHYKPCEEEEKMRPWMDGWCYEKKAQEVNGKLSAHPCERVQRSWLSHGCEWWVDAEDGYTRWDVNTVEGRKRILKGAEHEAQDTV